jgi:predicted permease
VPIHWSHFDTIEGRFCSLLDGFVMTTLRIWLSRILEPALRRRRDQRLSEEVQSHLDLLTEEYVARGLSRADARLAARKAFGGVDQIKDSYRERRGLPSLDEFLQDLRFAFRLMRKSKGFSLVAAGSLAVSIGAITLAFSAVNAFVWKPLPIRDPGSVYTMQSGSFGWSYLDYRDIRDRSDALDALAGFRIVMVNVGLQPESAVLWGYMVTGNYFDALGVAPAVGRFFTQAEDQQPGASPLVVLSFETWQSRFGGRADIVGRSIQINSSLFTVVGVAPRAFHGTEVFYRPELFVPMTMQRQIEPSSTWLDSRGSSNVMVVARVKAGLPRPQAQAKLAATVGDLNREFPNRNKPLTVTLTRPGLFGDVMGGPARAFVWGIFGLGALLLLTACSNIAGLLLARSTDRAREIAMRAALGAACSRITRQLLTESLVLAIAGGIGGAVLAWGGTILLARLHLPTELPVQIDVTANRAIVLFAFAVSLIVGLIVGLAPARFATRVDLNTSFKSPGTIRIGRQRIHPRDLLVGVQVALCLVLLHACFMSVQALQRSASASIGWNPSGLILAATDVGLVGYDDGQVATFHRRLLEEARQLPGIQAAAIGNSIPLHLDHSSTTVYADPPGGTDPGEGASIYFVSPGYFHTLQIPFRFGRDFDESDAGSAPPVVIVNRALADRLLVRGNAVSKRVKLGRAGKPMEIIGVVEDGKYQSLGEPRSPAIFRPTLQSYTRAMMILARVERSSGLSPRDLRQLILRLDPALPVRAVATGEDIAALPLFPYRTAVAALSVLGLIASGLLLTGLHALMAYAAARRRREIGVRLALGADRGSVARLILGRAGVILVAGIGVGVLLTLGTGPLVSSLVLGASPQDPALLAGIVAVLAAIVFISCFGPVRRALRVTPIAALREE